MAKVLSLFDGMACGMIAMKIAGMEVESYDAYEIDKYAIKTAQHNFPMIKEHGNVFDADFTQYEGVDFLIGGSPCTYWSIAQTKNRETVASGMGWELFSQYVRALHEAKPKYFIYENNKSMSKDIRASIDKAFGFEAVLINSALVSAQNRQRLYWVGKRNPDGTYSQVSVQQPEDRGILLRDILENGVVWQEKSYNLTTRCCGAIPEDTLKRHRHTMVAEPIRIGTIENDANNPTHESQQYRVYSPDGKGVTLCGNGGGLGAKTGLYATPVGTDADGILHLGSLYGQHSRWGMFAKDGKCPTITASMGMGGGHVPMVPTRTDEEGHCQKNPTTAKQIYEVRDGKISIGNTWYPIKLRDGFYIIRKLTVCECMRLQTVPEWYEFPVSDSQSYKMLGNGWTCEVISHILKYLKEA